MNTSKQNQLIKEVCILLEPFPDGKLKDYFLERAKEISPLQYDSYLDEVRFFSEQYSFLFEEEEQGHTFWAKRTVDQMLETLSWFSQKEVEIYPEKNPDIPSQETDIREGVNQIYFVMDSTDVGQTADRVHAILKRCIDERDFLDAYRLIQALFSIRIHDRFDRIETFYQYIQEYDLNRAHFFFNAFVAVYFCADSSVKFAQMAQLFEIGMDQNERCSRDFHQPLTKLSQFQGVNSQELIEFLPLWLEFLIDWADRELKKRGAYTPFPFYEVFELAEDKQLKDLTRRVAESHSELLPEIMNLFYFYPYRRVYIALAILETYGLQDHPAAKKAVQVLEEFKGMLEEPELLRLKKLWKEDQLYKKLREYQVEKAWNQFHEKRNLSSYLAAYRVFIPEEELMEKLKKEFTKEIDLKHGKGSVVFQTLFLEGYEAMCSLLSIPAFELSSNDFSVEELYFLLYLLSDNHKDALFSPFKETVTEEFLNDLDYWQSLNEPERSQISKVIKIIKTLVKDKAVALLEKRSRKDYKTAAILLALLEKFLNKHSDSSNEGRWMIREIRSQYSSLRAFLKELEAWTKTGSDYPF